MKSPVFHVIGTLFMALNLVVVFSILLSQQAGGYLLNTRDYRGADTRPLGTSRWGIGILRNCSVNERRGVPLFGMDTGTGPWFVEKDFFTIEE